MRLSQTNHNAARVSALGLILFLLLTALVQARLLTGLDWGAARATRALVGRFPDFVSAVFSVLVSAELSVVYGVVASFLLWRMGLGRWSLAPLVFVALVPLEFGLKLTVEQPPVPSELRREAYYPLLSLPLQGSFPSGHAIRTGFFCMFLAVLLWSRGGLAARLAPPGFALLAVLLGFTRLYLGHHWLSDVVAGLVLGASVALLAAVPVAERVTTHRR